MRLFVKRLTHLPLVVVLLGASMPAPAEDVLQRTFSVLDANQDGKLTADEYIRRTGNKDAHLRDLKLFDFNGDGALSRSEFAAVPGLVPAQERGPLPDPFDHLLEQAVDAMDVTHNNWDQRPEATADVSTFLTEFLRSLSPDQSIRLSASLINQADPNQDRRVSRDEARQFLAHQLGILSPRRELLRQPNGRVFDWGRYLWLDADRNGEVTSAEYVGRYPTHANAPRDFAARDRDGDGTLNRDEYADPQFPQPYNDPIELFRRADVDFDGRVSVDELAGVAQTHQQMLPALMIPTFDDDGDGLLSLSEFRVSMLGNTICGWHTARTDKNRDGVLTFDEFLFQPDDFLLLQRLYFYRFDADGDGRLIQSEFPYVEHNPNTLYRLAADGSSMELLWQDKSRPTAGSPEISPDGKWIAFDLYPEGKIMMVRSDGDIVTEVRGGLMPSWSADGQSFAYSQSGVSISDFNGHQRHEFANGWGAQWSPDGKSIAYTMNQGLWVYDVASEASREVLPQEVHPYATLYYGMTWSPDSRYVAIKATSGNVHDIIRIDTQGEKPAFDVLLSTTLSLSHDLTWSPDGKRLVFSMHSPQHGRNLLHQLELQQGASPAVFPGIDTSLTYMNQSFSRDGTWIVLTAK